MQHPSVDERADRGMVIRRVALDVGQRVFEDGIRKDLRERLLAFDRDPVRAPAGDGTAGTPIGDELREVHRPRSPKRLRQRDEGLQRVLQLVRRRARPATRPR
jgi:hypothetical protein